MSNISFIMGSDEGSDELQIFNQHILARRKWTKTWRTSFEKTIMISGMFEYV